MWMEKVTDVSTREQGRDDVAKCAAWSRLISLPCCPLPLATPRRRPAKRSISSAARRATTTPTAARRRARRCSKMTPSRIMRTLDFGAMMTVAYTMRRDEREAVAQFLGKPGAEPGPRAAAFCRTGRSPSSATTASWNGWRPARDNSRFVPAALAKLTRRRCPRLKLKWAFGFEGDISAFGQPTVDRRAGVRRERRRRRARAARRHRLPAVDVPGHRADSFGDRRRAPGRPARAALRRSHRLVLRARRRRRDADLEEAARRARGGATERAAGRPRRARA